MFQVQGRCNNCTVFADIVDNETQSQLINLMNQPFVSDSKIRIMPDCHAGAGCVIGTTMTLQDKVCPNLVGVDIGCGVMVVKLKEKDIDLDKLDTVIHTFIPSGAATHVIPPRRGISVNLINLSCLDEARIHISRAYCSVGTLGGGNHFIEVDRDKDGYLCLVIHTGSRHLGLEIAKYYQDKAYEILKVKKNGGDRKSKLNALIDSMRTEGKQKGISKAIEKFNQEYRELNPDIPKDLAYLEGEYLEKYLHDMHICQQFAANNREQIARTILIEMGLHEQNHFHTVHNYIDIENMILRKGAVSAQQGERLIIPMNMRDGSLICIGKGNSEWNYSAPHGAGRLMSRSQAKENISLSDFESAMKDIYTTCVNSSTIDESPMAYKPMESIVNAVQDTVEIVDIIKPIYNFKASV